MQFVRPEMQQSGGSMGQQQMNRSMPMHNMGQMFVHQQQQQQQQPNINFQQQRMASYQQMQQQQQQQQRSVQLPASPMGSPQSQGHMRMPYPSSPLGSPQSVRASMCYPLSPQMRVMQSPMGSPQSNMMMQPNSSPIRRPSGSSGPSPLPPERPLSTEHPPRTPSTPLDSHDVSQESQDSFGSGNMQGGGGFNNGMLPFEDVPCCRMRL